jgi:general secretion pathway protein G
MPDQLKNSQGFTLIEIMVVVAILALLAALVAPKIIGRFDDANIDSTKVQIRNLETGLKMYKLDNGVYPGTEQGLQALIEKPVTGVIPLKWKEGGYLDSKALPKDAWGREYSYISPGEHGDYDLCSYGADGVKGGEGKDADICSWNIH